MGETGLDHDALHLVEAEFVASAVVELGGAGRGMVGHRRRLLQRATILQVGRDARGLDASPDHGTPIPRSPRRGAAANRTNPIPGWSV